MRSFWKSCTICAARKTRSDTSFIIGGNKDGLRRENRSRASFTLSSASLWKWTIHKLIIKFSFIIFLKIGDINCYCHVNSPAIDQFDILLLERFKTTYDTYNSRNSSMKKKLRWNLQSCKILKTLSHIFPRSSYKIRLYLISIMSLDRTEYSNSLGRESWPRCPTR